MVEVHLCQITSGWERLGKDSLSFHGAGQVRILGSNFPWFAWEPLTRREHVTLLCSQQLTWLLDGFQCWYGLNYNKGCHFTLVNMSGGRTTTGWGKLVCPGEVSLLDVDVQGSVKLGWTRLAVIGLGQVGLTLVTSGWVRLNQARLFGGDQIKFSFHVVG